MERLDYDTKLVAEWFENNCMKINEDKCHFLVSGHRYESIRAQIGEVMIWESANEKLLGEFRWLHVYFV